MGIKIFAIVLLLFVLEIAFLTTQEPITLQVKKSPIDFSNITFENIHAYILTKEGLEAKVEAKEVYAYKARNELYNVKTVLYNPTHIDHIQADKAVHRGDILHLINDVSFESNTSLLLKSDDLVYNTKTKTAVSRSPFFMQHNNETAEGDSFIFDIKQNILHAKNITFSLEED